MKLSQMRYFQAVCLYGSTTRAADSLFVSQPSISMAIKELEEELHVKLFVRQNNRMMLTREGSFFLERVNRVLDEVRTLEQTMQHLNSSSTVTLSLPPSWAIFSRIFSTASCRNIPTTGWRYTRTHRGK